MHKAVEALTASGTKVIWLNLPNFQTGSGAALASNRVAAFNTLLTTLGTDMAGKVTVAGLGAWVAANGASRAEPTQNGWGAAAADHVVADYLAGQIAAVWRAAHTPGPTTTTTTAPGAPTTSISIPPAPAGVGGITKTTRTTTAPKASGSKTTKTTKAA